MKRSLILILVITTGGILCNDARAYGPTVEWSRVGGGAFLILGALGALQSAHDIVAGIREIGSLTDREEPEDYVRHMLPSVLVNRFVSIKSGPIFEGAGFCILLNGIVRTFLAKKGWDLMWQNYEGEQLHAQQESPIQDEA